DRRRAAARRGAGATCAGPSRSHRAAQPAAPAVRGSRRAHEPQPARSADAVDARDAEAARSDARRSSCLNCPTTPNRQNAPPPRALHSARARARAAIPAQRPALPSALHHLQLLERLAPASLPLPDDSDPNSRPTILGKSVAAIGERIGKYAIERELGRGGMG